MKQTINRILNGAKSTVAGIASVTALVISFSGILPPKVEVWAQIVSSIITALHIWYAKYGSEFNQAIGIDPNALK